MSLFLRLLLCVTLTLNGVSGASAAVRMAAGHAEHQGAAVQNAAVDQTMPPCHGHDAMTMDDMAQSAVPPEAPATPEEPEQCCDSSTCQCVCVHQCAATIVASLLTAPLQPAAGIERALDVSHRAPALPHLIRPPIR